MLFFSILAHTRVRFNKCHLHFTKEAFSSLCVYAIIKMTNHSRNETHMKRFPGCPRRGRARALPVKTNDFSIFFRWEGRGAPPLQRRGRDVLAASRGDGFHLLHTGADGDVDRAGVVNVHAVHRVLQAAVVVMPTSAAAPDSAPSVTASAETSSVASGYLLSLSFLLSQAVAANSSTVASSPIGVRRNRKSRMSCLFGWSVCIRAPRGAPRARRRMRRNRRAGSGSSLPWRSWRRCRS